jgi:hypothetical protein
MNRFFPSASRRAVLSGLLVTLLSRPAFAQSREALRPESFGARGDGQTDDTTAFQALSRELMFRGGGQVLLAQNAVYRVGRQVRAANGKAWSGEPIFAVKGLTGVEIVGNGAKLKLNDGLRYGSFDPSTGERHEPGKGKFTVRKFAADVGALIDISDCRMVRVRDLTLDGNAAGLQIGGPWGDTGRQLHAIGLRLRDVSDVTLERLLLLDHGQDGVYLRGKGRNTDSPSDSITFTDVVCRRNGRQGMSIVGGAGLMFTRCAFEDTGQGALFSRPGAGVDIEPNGSDCASLIYFSNCTFTNNRGVGLLAAEGCSHTTSVRGCTFWQGFVPKPGVSKGSGDAFWLVKTGVTIEDCAVHGTVTNLMPETQVVRCRFDDAAHPRLGRTAQNRRYLLDGAGGKFEDCSFTITGSGGQGLIHSMRPLLLRRCTLRYAGSRSKRGGFAVAWLAASVTLDTVTFTEAVPKGTEGGFYIYDGRPTLHGRVVVLGPRVRWGNPLGLIGNIQAAPAR